MKNDHHILLILTSALLLLLIAAGCSADGSEYVEVVQSGYLGEYTDITVQELLDGHYSLVYDTTTWDGGETESGQNIVEVKYQDSEGFWDDTTIQFTMLDEQCFKVSAFVSDLEEIEKATDLLATLNYIYLEQYGVRHPDEVGDMLSEQSLMERLDQISGSAVRYGAAKDYEGDRSQLYDLAGDTELTISVPWLLDSCGLLDMEEFLSSANGATPTREDIVIETDFFTITLPASWEGRYCTDQWDNEISYGLSLCERQSYDEGYGGELFSILVPREDYDYPSYEYLGSVAGLDVVARYPTDVQFSEAGQFDYLEMSEDIPGILSTLSIKADADISSAGISAEDYLGQWWDSYSQRCNMTVGSDGTLYDVEIHWPSGASEDNAWYISAQYNAQTGELEYESGTSSYTVYDEDGSLTEQANDLIGPGRFYFDGSYLCWSEITECRFER